MKITSIAVVTGLLSLANAVAITNPDGRYSFVEHESVENLPAGWQSIAPAKQDELITLRVYLRNSGSKVLQIAEDVSNPSSSRYGHYLTAEGLRDLLPDHDKATTAVRDWLTHAGIEEHSTGHDWVEFTTPVARAQDLLRASFGKFQHEDGRQQIRTKQYSLPAHMTEHVDFVYPTVHFFNPTRGQSSPVSSLSRRQHIPNGPQNCTNNVCPPQLKKQYNIDYRPQNGSSGSHIGIAGFLEQFPNITDVNGFLSQYGLNDTRFVPPPMKFVSVNNGTLDLYDGGGSYTVEAELDVDYVTAFTGPLPVTFISTGGRGTQLTQPGNKVSSQSDNEPYLDFMQWLLSQKSPPQVISISYSDDEQSVPVAYARRVCDLFAQAAARGISLIGASGDGAAEGTSSDSGCIGPDGKHRFVPTFPSSCPWYTSVGATAAYGGVASYSSGGFSNYFARPAWQDKAALGYIKELNGSHSGYYNASGRGIPDVSLLGDNYLTLTGGYAGGHDGTSASTPLFAAMIALINDIRLRNKKPVLGFLNPRLYAANATSVFRDVADGSQSTGCAFGDTFEDGWQALRGWDAATGLGEPNFSKLRKLLAQ